MPPVPPPQAVLRTQATSLSLPNTARVLESVDYVYALDRATQAVVKQLLEAQQRAGYGVGGLLVWEPLPVTVQVSPDALGMTNDKEPTSPLPASPTPATPNAAETSATSPAPAAQPADATAPSSGFKLMRKAVKPRAAAAAAPTSPTSPSSAPTEDAPASPAPPLVPASTDLAAADTPASPSAPDTAAPSATAPSAAAPSAAATVSLTLKQPVSAAALLDLRRAFTRTATMLSLQGAESVARAFVEFLQPRV